MSKNWEKTGYLIPENINPDENICICVPVPKDWGHIRAFMGQLTELSKWITWEKTGGTEAAQAARRWFDITECVQEAIDCAMSDGCGCGSSAKPTNTRINPETGIYEESFDGGITWIPAPEDDIRSSGTLFPVIPGSPGSTKKCQQANSVVAFLEAQQARELADLENNATIAEMITGMIGALAGIGLIFAFVPSAIVALLAFVVNTFAHLIADDFGDQFTSSTWDTLLCIVYCSIQANGSFREADWYHIQNEAVDQIGGYAGYWIKDHVNLIGVVGLNNAANANYPGSRSCDGCECGTCISAANVILGTVQSISGNTIVIDSVLATRNGITAQWVVYGSDDDEFCCLLCAITPLGGYSSGGWTDCDGNPQPFTSPVGQMIRSAEYYGAGTFQVTYVFADDDGCPP